MFLWYMALTKCVPCYCKDLYQLSSLINQAIITRLSRQNIHLTFLVSFYIFKHQPVLNWHVFVCTFLQQMKTLKVSSVVKTFEKTFDLLEKNDNRWKWWWTFVVLLSGSRTFRGEDSLRSWPWFVNTCHVIKLRAMIGCIPECSTKQCCIMLLLSTIVNPGTVH